LHLFVVVVVVVCSDILSEKLYWREKYNEQLFYWFKIIYC